MPAPELGRRALDGKTRKEFKMSLSGQTFSGSEKDLFSNYRLLFETAALKIEQGHLNRGGSFNLLRCVLTGPALAFLNSQESSGISFSACFRSLQSMLTKYFNPSDIMHKINEVKNPSS